MQRIQLPNSPVHISQLVYGVWRLTDDQDQSTRHVRAKIDAALAEGITTFDHADIYGNYECEQAFGRALTDDPTLRDKIELISKCDIAIATDKFPSRRVKYYDTSESYIRQSVDTSLSLLQTDYLDSLLLHRPDPLMNAAETGATLDALIDSGKIRSAGVSNFKPDDWRLLQKHMKHALVINQIEMGPLALSPFTNGDLSALQLDNIQPMAWSPLSGGKLFSNDHAATRTREVLARVAQEQNSRIDLVAFAWLLKHPANICPVVGTHNIDRIKGLNSAFNLNIDTETWYEIWTAASGQEVP